METRKGIFYGVGVGPGDPELLTLKAVRVLKDCPVIAAPRTKNGAMLALEIVRQAVDLSGKRILPLDFSMERDRERQAAAHALAAAQVQPYLAGGQDVAMLNLGDVSIYATYSYLMESLRREGFEAVMVPGVPSFCAVAARLGESLTEGSTPLHIIPASYEPLEQALALPGTKVLMKSGKRIPKVIETLCETGHLEGASMVQECGLPGEAVYRDLHAVPEPVGYFATIIVKE